MVDGEPLAAVRPGPRGGRPIYISVGHRITLGEALSWTDQLRHRGRLPEPLELADRLSRTPRNRVAIEKHSADGD